MMENTGIFASLRRYKKTPEYRTQLVTEGRKARLEASKPERTCSAGRRGYAPTNARMSWPACNRAMRLAHFLD